MMRELVTIDGSQGEGGGQILRTSLSLSAIRGQPFRLENIRAGREKPGLKRQHLTCIKAVAEICNARYSEIDVGSSELEFIPGEIKAGSYRFDVGTAGSVTLVAQTVIPVLLKADAPSTVVITGGTHVPHAPIWEFFEKCYLPELRRMGVRIEAEMVQPGFYPAAGGVVKLKDRSKRMGKCFGCVWDKVGCPHQKFWSDRVSRPCQVHTEKELEEKERERRESANS